MCETVFHLGMKEHKEHANKVMTLQGHNQQAHQATIIRVQIRRERTNGHTMKIPLSAHSSKCKVQRILQTFTLGGVSIVCMS